MCCCCLDTPVLISSGKQCEMSSQSEKQKNAVKQRMMRMLEENESVKERLAEAEREGERVREQLKEAEEKRANLKEQELEVDKVATELEASSAKLEEKYKVAEAVSGSHVGGLKAKLSFMAIQKISAQKMKQKFGC